MKEIYQNSTSKKFINIFLFFLLIYLSFIYLGIDFERFFSAFGSFGNIIVNRYYPADIEYILDPGYLHSILNSIQMAYVGLVLGVIIASILSYFAAINITPSKNIAYPHWKIFYYIFKINSRDNLDYSFCDYYWFWDVSRCDGANNVLYRFFWKTFHRTARKCKYEIS